MSSQKACCDYNVKIVMGDIPQGAHGDETAGNNM
jgi:hypothetical protein